MVLFYALIYDFPRSYTDITIKDFIETQDHEHTNSFCQSLMKESFHTIKYLSLIYQHI